VSIVLPTYNGSRYLQEAVDSIINQTYQRWELLIVDDASTDETPRLLASLMARDARIRSFRNAENRKLPASLNRGFAQVTGELLTWTSDDNAHRPEAIALLVDLLGSHPDVDIAYSDYTEIEEDGSPIRHMGLRDASSLPFDNVVGPCFLDRARVQQRLRGYAEDMFLAEDYDFWLRASCHFRFARLSQDLYKYRVHSGSLTARRAGAAILAHQQTLCRNLPHMHRLTRRAKALAYLELARRAFRRDDLAGVRSLFWHAIRQSPMIAFLPDRTGRGRRTSAARQHAEPAESFWALSAFAVAGKRGCRQWVRLTQFIRRPGPAIRNRLRRLGRLSRRR
jgi:glycosyltransferase involved in cell wall biosynthesis